MCTRVHGSTSDEPLATFLPWKVRSKQGILCNFGCFLSKFGCHGNSLGSLKISDSIFKCAAPKNLTIRLKKSSIFLCRTKISAIFAYVCPNLVAMATLLAPLKFQIAYLNSTTSKTLLFVWKSSRFFAQNWNRYNFCLVLPKFGCHGNSLNWVP